MVTASFGSAQGKTKYSTADKIYESYTPHGWMRHPGEDIDVEKKVFYHAVPAYYGLTWSGCRNEVAEAKKDTALAGCDLFTGVASLHRVGHNDLYSAYPYNNGHEKSTVLTLNKSTFGTPLQIQGRCSLQSKGQFLMAEGYDRSDGATCERIGTTCGKTAVAKVNDASETGKLTNHPSFKDVYGRYHNGPRKGVFRGEAICKYRYNSILTPAHLKDVKQKIIEKKLPNNLEFKTPLLSSFCTKVNAHSPSHPCLINLDHGEFPENCSYMTTNNEVGEICREWLDEYYAGDKHGFDSFLFGFCNENNDLPECACVNREQDEVFKAVKKVTQFSPRCWWNACRAPNGSVMNDSSTRDQRCETTLCANFITVIDSAGVNIQGAISNIACDTSSSGTGSTGSENRPGDSSQLGGDDAANVSTDDDDETFFSSLGDDSSLMIGGGIVVVVIIIIIFVVATSGGEKKK